VIAKELADPRWKAVKLSLCFLGFMLMALIKVFDEG
jgi:hypothetical protein